MAELTKEYFDDRMSTLRQDVGDVRREVVALQEDVSTLQGNVSTLQRDVADIRNTMATKEDLAALRSDMNTKFDAMFELLDTRKKIEQLESDMRNVKHELKLV